MQYNKGPSIINTYPKNYQTGIPTDAVITVEFDIDISKASISGNVQVLNYLGEKVDCRLTYQDRKVLATPRSSLKGSSSYKVVVKGDNNPNDATAPKGITNPLGTPMLGDYVFTFSTYSEKSEVEELYNGTPNNIVLTEQPTFRAEITHNTQNTMMNVHIQISDSNTFDDILWDGESDISGLTDGIIPDYDFKDGSYYWRIRARGQADGNWSETFQFALERTGESTVVADDTVELDVAFPTAWDMLEANVIAVYPEDGFSNVSTNLKTITIVLDKIIPHEILNESTLTLTGLPVDEDESREGHGEVKLDLVIAYDHHLEQTTLVLSLPELGVNN